jgi:hypothetical protein
MPVQPQSAAIVDAVNAAAVHPKDLSQQVRRGPIGRRVWDLATRRKPAAEWYPRLATARHRGLGAAAGPYCMGRTMSGAAGPSWPRQSACRQCDAVTSRGNLRWRREFVSRWAEPRHD